MSSSRRADRDRTWAAAAALVVGLMVSLAAAGFAAPLETSPPQIAATAEQVGLEPTAPPPPVEREAILGIIREHRRGASDPWRERLADAIFTEAVEAAVDPLLVASIVAKESSFRSQVVSHAGAVGLMQLRPWVARDVARRQEMEWRGLDTLHDPSLNVRLGISYYKELVQRFDGDERKALTAYNYGPTRVSRQLRDGTYSGSRYAEEILHLYDRLHAIRGDDRLRRVEVAS